MAALLHCDELFLQFFDHWYDDKDRKRKGFKATRPDFLQTPSLIGLSQREASPLDDEGQNQVLHRIETMVEAARNDWPGYLDVSGELNLDWIDSFDRYYNKGKIAGVIKRSNPEDFSNDYVVLCCEFGAALGYVMLSMQSRLAWHLEWPYWESALLDPKTGTVIPVFHWAIKKMSNYGWDDGFAKKTEACIQLLDKHEGQ